MCCVDRGQITVSFIVLPPGRTQELAGSSPNACHVQKTPADQLVLHCRVCRFYYRNASATGPRGSRFACRELRPSGGAGDSSWDWPLQVAVDTRTVAPVVCRGERSRLSWPNTRVARAVGNH